MRPNHPLTALLAVGAYLAAARADVPRLDFQAMVRQLEAMKPC